MRSSLKFATTLIDGEPDRDSKCEADPDPKADVAISQTDGNSDRDAEHKSCRSAPVHLASCKPCQRDDNRWVGLG